MNGRPCAACAEPKRDVLGNLGPQLAKFDRADRPSGAHASADEVTTRPDLTDLPAIAVGCAVRETCGATRPRSLRVPIHDTVGLLDAVMRGGTPKFGLGARRAVPAGHRRPR